MYHIHTHTVHNHTLCAVYTATTDTTTQSHCVTFTHHNTVNAHTHTHSAYTHTHSAYTHARTHMSHTHTRAITLSICLTDSHTSTHFHTHTQGPMPQAQCTRVCVLHTHIQFHAAVPCHGVRVSPLSPAHLHTVTLQAEPPRTRTLSSTRRKCHTRVMHNAHAHTHTHTHHTHHTHTHHTHTPHTQSCTRTLARAHTHTHESTLTVSACNLNPLTGLDSETPLTAATPNRFCLLSAKSLARDAQTNLARGRTSWTWHRPTPTQNTLHSTMTVQVKKTDFAVKFPKDLRSQTWSNNRSASDSSRFWT